MPVASWVSRWATQILWLSTAQSESDMFIYTQTAACTPTENMGGHGLRQHTSEHRQVPNPAPARREKWHSAPCSGCMASPILCSLARQPSRIQAPSKQQPLSEQCRIRDTPTSGSMLLVDDKGTRLYWYSWARLRDPPSPVRLPEQATTLRILDASSTHAGTLLPAPASLSPHCYLCQISHRLQAMALISRMR